MPGFLVQVGATLICPHAGQVQITSTNFRVKVSGQPVATLSDVYAISACSFQLPTVPAPTPAPCLQVKWTVAALRVKVNGQPALVQSAVGMCIGSGPPGPPSVLLSQVRVKGM